MDAMGGGTYKMSFTNFTSGKSHTFGGTYPPTHGIRHGRSHPWNPHDGHQDVGQQQHGQRGRRSVLP